MVESKFLFMVFIEVDPHRVDAVALAVLTVDTLLLPGINADEQHEHERDAQSEHVDGGVHLVSRQEGEIRFEIE